MLVLQVETEGNVEFYLLKAFVVVWENFLPLKTFHKRLSFYLYVITIQIIFDEFYCKITRSKINSWFMIYIQLHVHTCTIIY